MKQKEVWKGTVVGEPHSEDGGLVVTGKLDRDGREVSLRIPAGKYEGMIRGVAEEALSRNATFSVVVDAPEWRR